MAKFELKFIDVEDDNTIETFVENGLIKIIIEGNYGCNGGIVLDKSTAIKFAKTLRTEINKITESEAVNG